MLVAAIPTDEPWRLEALASLEVLDTPPDEILDGLVRTAAAVIGCPLSALSLVAEERQWFKARFGLDVSETSRDYALCAHAILQDDLFEVGDCLNDSRFADNPFIVGVPPVRFYAGVPIAIDGHNVGTFCVMDHVPRTLKPAQRALLADLGRVAQHWLESRRENRLLIDSSMPNKTLFDHLDDGVILVDRAGQIRDANAHALAMLGYERRELIGQRVSMVLPDDRRAPQAAGPVASVPRGVNPSRDCTVLRKDGSRVHAEVYAQAMGDRGSLMVVRDVTERHAREQLLQRHSQAIEQCFAGIMICDLDGTIVCANKAASTISGYGSAELIGGNQRVLALPGMTDATFKAATAEVRAGGRWSGVLTGRRKNGSDYAQLTSVSPIVAENGTLTHTLIVTEDVTEKQRLSTELEENRNSLEDLSQRSKELALAKRAAEAASRAKSDFLASMSHEIRTPMNGVLGIVEVLRASSLDPYQVELADTIRDSALALLGLIDEVLDFSKIEAGHLEITREPLDLQVLAESVCDALLPVAMGRGVSLDVFVSPDLPARVFSDDLRLRQLLNNLLGNAIKFSSGRAEPGRVWLRVEPCRSATAPDDGKQSFRIIVGDNGIGMARNVQKRVFEPFVQAEGSTTRRFGGTGLGLSICQKLVASFGGTISLRSAPEKGSVFTLTLPLEPMATHAAVPDVGLLGGLHCHLLLRDMSRARDWAAYLTAAGATTRAWRHCPSPQAMTQSRKGRRHVLLIDWDDPASASLRTAATNLGIPMVQVHQGTHRGSQLIRHAMVWLDSGAVRRSSVVDAVALAAGRRLPAVPFGNSPARVPRKADRVEAVAQGRLILIAEDNDLNRKVIEQQLALLGHSADVAANGVDALERWRTGNYALLLTDLHMPYMDGYTLAARIRAEEASRAAESDAPPARLPILALTANALRGEAERCLALGMDDYLTKPLQLEPLSQTLTRWLPQSVQPATVALPAPAEVETSHGDIGGDAGALAVYDATMLPKLVGDDPAVLAEVRAEFVESAMSAARTLRVAVANGESAIVGSFAHRLKSSARAVGAVALGYVCARLEEAATMSPGMPIEPLLVEFESALALLLAAIARDQPAADDVQQVAPVAAIMVVDDEHFQLQIIQKQLEFQSAPVFVYDSATAALAALNGRDTSAMLLLFDLNMPGMDGVELMRHLAERRFAGAIALISGADTRVLETASKLATAYNLNVLGYLSKPVMPEVLRDVIDRWRTFIPRDSNRQSKTYAAVEIRQAIARDQFFLQYQPKVSMKDGSVVGVEALVRWRHPVDGVLYPDRFIEVAESHDLIDDLTYVILEKAVAQARVWKDGGLELRVAVNISMRNLAKLDFPGRVLEIIERHGVRPDDMVLEVTESTLMSDARAPLSTLTRLRLRAVGLSIDDFGTGHSSLAQLRDIPFDELKIDRGFIHGVWRQPTQQAIFLASLNMAHQLNMQVVAEGVEDAADWDFVRDAGCDVAQGYHIARPMDAAAVGTWAAAWASAHRETTDVHH